MVFRKVYLLYKQALMFLTFTPIITSVMVMVPTLCCNSLDVFWFRQIDVRVATNDATLHVNDAATGTPKAPRFANGLEIQQGVLLPYAKPLIPYTWANRHTKMITNGRLQPMVRSI